MTLTGLIGGLAVIASTTSFAPQAWKIIKSRDTTSISASMYAVTVAGFCLWLIYGLSLGSWPLIISNGVCLALSGFILVMTLLPQREKEAVADQIDPAATPKT